MLLASMACAGSAIAASLSFTPSDYTVAENVNTVNVIVHRDVTAGALDVDYTTVEGTALAGKNYTAASGTLHFNAGDNDLLIPITILDNLIYDTSRAFSVRITASGYTSPANAVVTITENDAAPIIVLLPVTANPSPDATTVTDGNPARIKAVKVSGGPFTPLGIAVDLATGNVFVTDSDNHRVLVYDATGNYLRQFGSYGTGDSNLLYPYGIAINSTSYVYVSDSTNQVKVFRNDGTFLYKINSGSLSAPRGVGIDRTTGEVYVVSSGNNRIVKYDNAGRFVKYIDSYLYPNGTNLYFSSPTGIAVNSTGFVYVADTGNNLIKVFNGNLNYVTQFSLHQLAINSPAGISIRLDTDDVFVVDQKNYRVVCFDRNNQISSLTTMGIYGTSEGQFKNPRMIVCSPVAVYITDTDLNRVTQYSTAAVYQRVWGGLLTALPATIYYDTTDGTAFAGSDKNYTRTTGQVTFLPSETVKEFTVSTNPAYGYNTVDRYFTVSATGATNAIIGNYYPSVRVWIDNTRARPAVQFSPASVSVDKNSGTIMLTVTLTGQTEMPASVNYQTVDGTAKAGKNYTGAAGTINFAAGETSKTIPIDIIPTTGYNVPVTFSVALQSPTNAALGAGSTAQVTITNTDLPRFVFDSSVYRIDEDDDHVTIRVLMEGTTAIAASVPYRTANITAMAGKNYTATTGTLTFAPGESAKTFSVPIIPTTGFNPESQFFVVLDPPTNALWGIPNSAIVKIENVDGAPAVEFDPAAYTVNDNAGSVWLTLIRAGALEVDSTVTYYTIDGTARKDTNYTATTDTVTFHSGESTKRVSIPILPALGLDGDKAFSVSLKNPIFSVIGTQSTATVNIHNVHQPPLLQFNVSSYLVNEDATSVTINVTRTGLTTMTASVDYATTDGTAKDGINYDHRSGTLTFRPEDTFRTFEVPIRGVAGFNPDLLFTVTLSNPVNAVLDSCAATVTIKNVDQIPVFQFSDPAITVSEDVDRVTFTVTKTGTTTAQSTIIYSTVDGTAKAGVNFDNTVGALTFLPGETSKTFTVPMRHWPGYSPTQSFTVTLQTPLNANIGTPDTVTVTVLNVDPVPTLQFSASDFTVDENAVTATITVTKAGQSSMSSSVEYYTTDGNATAQNYTAAAGTLTFAPGETSKTISVSVANWPGYSPSVYFNIALRNPAGATLGTPDSATVTILNFGPKPTLQFSSALYNYNENAEYAIITVTLAGITTVPASVSYTTSDGNATAGVNYTAASGTLNFAAGQTTQTFAVPIRLAMGYKPNVYFNVILSSPVNALLGSDSTAKVYINNVDSKPLLGFDITAVNVNEDIGLATFTVTKTGTTSMNALVDYYTGSGNAVPGDNYTTTLGTLTFLPDETVKTFTVPIINTPGYQPVDRTFTVYLSNPVDARLGMNNNVQVTIKNVDNQYMTAEFSQASYSINEDAVSIGLPVRLSSAPVTPVTVSYTTTSGTALPGRDYTTKSGTLTFNAGVTEQTITVSIRDDDVYAYPNRVFYVNLTGYTGIAGFGANRNVSVTKLETSPGTSVQFNLSSYAYSQNSVNAVLRLTLSSSMPETVWVDYATHDGTAKAGKNFTGGAGRAEFAPGETYKLVQIPITDTGAYNPDLMFFYVNITATSTNVYTGTPNVANVTILNTMAKFTLHLIRGWNLITFPVINNTFYASMITPGCGIDRVAAFEPTNQTYHTYLVGRSYPDKDFPLTVDNGYFLYCTVDSMDYTFYGVIPAVPRTLHLYPGWTMIGWAPSGNSTAKDFGALSMNITRVTRHDAPTQSYNTYLVGRSYDDRNFNMSICNGYFVFSNATSIINVNI
jgi:hypothetical protein